MSQNTLIDQLLRLDAQYEQITGHCAFLYVSDAAGPGAYHFTEDRVIYGVRSALAHMRWLVRKAAEELAEEGA